MPPKSASKKDRPLYFQDEETKYFIFNQSSDEFKAKGDYSYYNPNTEVYHPTKVEIRYAFGVEEKLSASNRRNLIFLNYQVMQVLGVVAADQVMVTITLPTDGSTLHTFTKRCWAIEDRALDTVRIVEDEMWRFKSCPDSEEKLTITIQKLKDSLPTDEVILSSEDVDDLTNEQRKHVMLLLKRELQDVALSKNEEIRLKFLQRHLSFTVHRFVGPRNEIDDELRKLNLGDSPVFHLIDKKTKISLENTNGSDDFLHQPLYLGGLEKQEKEILEVVNTTKNRWLNSSKTKISLTKGILIHGASGCGKSSLVKSILKKVGSRFVEISGSELFSRYYGETESNINAVFEKVQSFQPEFTIIVVEDIQNLCPKGDSSDIGRRVTSAFIDQIDRLNSNQAIILATTNQLEELNAVVRRSGRLDYEVEVSVPNEINRSDIIRTLLDKHEVSSNFSDNDIQELASTTHGYTGADLESLIIKTFYTVGGKSQIKLRDVMTNLTIVKPSAMREVQIESPNVFWTDIGGQQELKLKLQQAIEWPIKHPETFQRLGITPPRGLLMFGPPGCSKTMIAKALATESGVNFLSIKGSELFSMWVGESEKAVRKLFQKAREVAPAIIFFDEIDAIGGERSNDGGTSGSSVKERVLAQILTEIDGVHVLKDVTIVAATNRPDLIDKALMRPGRLDRIIYVGLPDSETRHEIFKIKLRKMPVTEDVKIDSLVELTEGYSGAEIQAVCQEAALYALEKSLKAEQVDIADFEFALKTVKPRTSGKLLQVYEDYLQNHQGN